MSQSHIRIANKKPDSPGDNKDLKEEERQKFEIISIIMVFYWSLALIFYFLPYWLH